jgi:hypothetical protein
MASWWHPQQQSQQQQTQPITGEPYDYSSVTTGQPKVPAQFFYDSHMIMVDGGNNDEYLIHASNHPHVNDGNAVDHHHRRHWYNG